MKIQIQKKLSDDHDQLNFTFFQQVNEPTLVEEERHRRTRSYQLNQFHNIMNNNSIQDLLKTSNFHNLSEIQEQFVNENNTAVVQPFLQQRHQRQLSSTKELQQFFEKLKVPQKQTQRREAIQRVKGNAYRFNVEQIQSNNTLRYSQIKEHLESDGNMESRNKQMVNSKSEEKIRPNFFKSRMNFMAKNIEQLRQHIKSQEKPNTFRPRIIKNGFMNPSSMSIEQLPKKVKLKVVPKPVISQSKLPPDFILKKRLMKSKSEEKFILNDFVDFTNHQNESSQQGRGEPLSRFLNFKNKAVDYINSQYLDDRDPDLYKTLVLQKKREEFQKRRTQMASKFQSQQIMIDHQQNEVLNSSRSSLFDIQQIKIINQTERSDDEMRESFYQTKEQMRGKRIQYTSPDFKDEGQRQESSMCEKEDLELQISHIHVKMKKEHKKRINNFVKLHNEKLRQIQTLKQSLAQSPQELNDDQLFLQLVRQGHCQEVYNMVLSTPELLQIRDQDNNTALHIAVNIQNYEMVELLIFMGIDVYTKCSSRKDAEDLAAEGRNVDIFNLIKMKKSNYPIRFNMWKIREYDRINQREIIDLTGKLLKIVMIMAIKYI